MCWDRFPRVLYTEIVRSRVAHLSPGPAPSQPELLLSELLATGFILPHILSFLHRAHCSGAPYIGVLRWGFLPWSSLHHGFVDQALFFGVPFPEI